MDARKSFGEFSIQYRSQSEVLNRKAWKVAVIRFITFLLGLLAAYFTFGTGMFFPLMLGWLLLFGVLISWYQRVIALKNLSANIAEICDEEMRRLDDDFTGVDNGLGFRDPHHPYANDLDIFGDNSLYQHLTRCELDRSRQELSRYLRNPVSMDLAQERQNAIRELADRSSWLLEFRGYLIGGRTAAMKAVDLSAYPINRTFQLVSYVLPIITLGCLLTWFLGILPLSYPITLMLINGLILKRFQKKMGSLDLSIDETQSLIQVYLNALKHISRTDFQADLLKKYKEIIASDTLRAFKQLSQLVYLLNTRSNFFYQILNVTMLLDLHVLGMLNKWIRINNEHFESWIGTVHHFESLGSMAMYAHTHRNFIFPFLDEHRKGIRSIDLGHPLIKDSERVSNDFITENEKVILVTGSNMSGKSTFLRTLGVNMTMAWIGLPVCASQFESGRFVTYTSMRTEDNLAEHTSSFYAELKRIKSLLDYIDGQENKVLYLLDEILKGTNSTDRHGGAKGLIEYLLKTETLGFISTHDLELSLEYEDHPLVRNMSFNSEFDQGKLTFDYKLSEGKCVSTNATELMKSMGLPT